jgi:MoaA/NifB/PqqE/SkfB family radical SAM enzyme
VGTGRIAQEMSHEAKLRPTAYYLEMARKLKLRSIPKLWNYAKYRILPRREIVSYAPQIVTLFLTPRCTLKCSYCSASKWMAGARWDKDQEATLETVQKIMAHPMFSKAIFVDLLGGEPLLVRDLGKIVKHISDKGHLTNLVTNGFNLHKRIYELKEAGLSRINISLYPENR